MAVTYAPQGPGIGEVLMQLREAAERQRSQGLQDDAARLAIAEKLAQQQQANAALQALTQGGAQVMPTQAPPMQFTRLVHGGVNSVQGPSTQPMQAPQAPQLAYTPDPMAALSTEVQAQVRASNAQAASKAPRRGVDTRLAQAPGALAAVQADRSRTTALAALDEHERSILSATDDIVDTSTRERAIADIKLARGQIEAGGNPAQVAQLLTSMGSTAGQIVDRAISVESVRNARNEKTRLTAATEGLRKLGVEVPEGVEYVEGADEYFLRLDEMARAHTNQLALIGANEAAEGRAEATRTRNRREEIAAQTEGQLASDFVGGIQTNMQLLMKDSRFANNPEGLMAEATSRSLAQIRAVNPTMATRLQAEHVGAAARQYAGGTQLMRNYVQEILTLSATENVAQDTRYVRGPFHAPMLDSKEILPQKIAPTQIAALEGQWLQFAANQGIDEGAARQIWRIEGAREIIDGYNAGIDEMKRVGLPMSKWPEVARANITDGFLRIRGALTNEPYRGNEPLTRINARKRFFEERFRDLPTVPRNRNTAGQPVGRPSILTPAREPGTRDVVSRVPR